MLWRSVAGGIAYGVLLFGWHWVCLRHYEAATTTPVITKPDGLLKLQEKFRRRLHRTRPAPATEPTPTPDTDADADAEDHTHADADSDADNGSPALLSQQTSAAEGQPGDSDAVGGSRGDAGAAVKPTVAKASKTEKAKAKSGKAAKAVKAAKPKAAMAMATATTAGATGTAAPATVATAAKSSAATAASASATTASCPAERRPFHTLLTCQDSIYQAWQSRIMYFHWKKQAAAGGDCTEMTGFTRLVASTDAKPDGLEAEMPTAFVKSLTPSEMAELGHFGVMNRPYSVLQFIQSGGLDAIPEDFLYIAETDHVLAQPMPNLATAETPAAYFFGYMMAFAGHQPIIDKHSPGTSWRSVQPIGPSPVHISKATLRVLTPLWYNISVALKMDKVADARFGWVLEMWGYSIAAAALGVQHKVLKKFQVEGGAGIGAPTDQYIFHYTYGIEYRLDGKRQGVNTIGEWSLDKRHYGSSYPPRQMRPPPNGASAGAHWLLAAWNEASAGIPAWPKTKALGTVGWRRLAGEGIEGSALAQRVMGTKWTWAGIQGLEFLRAGQLKTPWGSGGWGVLAAGTDLNEDGHCADGCVFADFSGALHNLRFDFAATPNTFRAVRVGDGEIVLGEQREA